MDMDMDRQRLKHKAEAQAEAEVQAEAQQTETARQAGRDYQVRLGVKSQSFVRVANDVAVRCRTEADRQG